MRQRARGGAVGEYGPLARGLEWGDVRGRLAVVMAGKRTGVNYARSSGRSFCGRKEE